MKMKMMMIISVKMMMMKRVIIIFEFKIFKNHYKLNIQILII